MNGFIGQSTGAKCLRALRTAGVAWLALSAGWSHAQAINDVPMAVKSNVAPNLMFMIDDSTSMLNIVPEADDGYDATINYTPTGCSGGNVLTSGTIDLVVVAGAPRFVVNGDRSNNRQLASSDTRYRLHGVTGTESRRCFSRLTNFTNVRLTANVTDGTFSSPENYGQGQYTGNYLNWYFSANQGPVTGWVDRKRLTSGVMRHRLDITKSAANSVLNTTLNAVTAPANAAVRTGLSTYSEGNGGRIRQPMRDFTTTHRTDMTTAVAGIVAKGSTPLGETLGDIGRYMATGYSGNITAGSVTGVAIDNFLRQGSVSPSSGRLSCLNGANCEATTTDAAPAVASLGTPSRPIQYWCQRSYAILMTDGLPSDDNGFANNPYMRGYGGITPGGDSTQWTYTDLDNLAKALFDVDLRPNLPHATAGQTKKNNLVTYAIAFADDQVRTDPFLSTVATNGGGRRLNAGTEAELTNAFKQVITDAFAKDAAAGAAAVSSAQITTETTGYKTSFRSGDWYGDLVAYDIDTTTALPTSANLWSLRANIRAMAWADRKIVSHKGTAGALGTNGAPFTSTDFPSVETKPGMVDFLRGDTSKGGDAIGDFRSRKDSDGNFNVLGDIINSEPVVVNYSGTPIIFVGANDGMLHVVDGRKDSSVSTRGQELWAYVPRLLHSALPSLADQAYSHKYYVDGTPVVAEVTGVSGVTRLLVGGLGKGGRGYYALNVSDYNAATVADAAAKAMWEFGASQANMGYSFGTPLIVNTASGWRVLVTSGYANGTTNGGDGIGRLWVLNPASGAVEATISTGVGSAANPSGLAHISLKAYGAADAVTRYVYGGDLLGNMWRFDLNSATAVKIAELRDPLGNTQPITSPPEVGSVPGTTDKVYVYVGTGKYLHDDDVPGGPTPSAAATQQQSMYGIIDDTSVGAPSLPDVRGTNGATCPTGGGNGDLVCQELTYVSAGDNSRYNSTTHTVNTNTKRGWYFDFPVDSRLGNARVIGKPVVTRRGTVVFTANVPTNERCLPGGSSYLFSVYGLTGGRVPTSIPATDYHEGVGQFIANALASRPILVTNAGSRPTVIVRLGDDSIANRQTGVRIGGGMATGAPPEASLGVTWRRIYWRSIQ
jgi:type IV pilus assembly protein PilY1